MKKILSFCLVIALLFVSFLVGNIYQTKDKIRINNIELVGDSFNFYVSHSQKSLSEELEFFKALSQEEGVSIFRTDRSNERVVKSVVFDEASFPFTAFHLKKSNLFSKSDSVYANFKTGKTSQVGEIPTFTKESQVSLQSMADYYKDTSLSPNGVYSIVSEGNFDKDKIVKKLGAFFMLDEKTLLDNPMNEAVGFVNQSLMIFVAILIGAVLVLAIVSTYVPLTELKKIGVKKLNGLSNASIFLDFTRFNFFLILIVSALIDIGALIYFNFHPEGFFVGLILAQLGILVLFCLINLLVYLIIKNVTINKMLKHFLNFRYGLVLSFVIKGLISLLITFLLVLISTEINAMFAERQIQKEWKSKGELLTVEYTTTSGQAYQDFLLDNGKNEQRVANLFKSLEKDLGAMYIRSYTVNPLENLGEANGNHPYKANESYELMKVNDNFIKTLSLKIEGQTIQAGQGQPVKEFFVPKSYQDSDKMTYLAQHILFSEIRSKDKEKVKMREIPVKVSYYDDQNFSTFTYNSETGYYFKKPIFIKVDSNHFTAFEESLFLATGENSPIKIENSEENRKQIEEIISKQDMNGFGVKFSTLHSIIGNRAWIYESGIQIASFILVFVFALSVFTSLFLLFCIMMSEKEKLAVYRILGISLWHRYQWLFTIFLAFYGIQFLVLLIFGKSLLVFPYLATIILIDGLITITTIIRKEKKSLPSLLKGE